MKSYFKSAWRNTWHQSGTSIINITGLAISMWAAILIFIWVQNEMSFDTDHKNANDIFLIKNYIGADKKDVSIWENSPYLLGEKAQETIPEIVQVARIQPRRYPVTYVNQNETFIKEDGCAYVDSSWFKLFEPTLISGNIDAFNSNPQSILLSSSKAKKYFGNENAIGKTLKIDTVDYKVQGILADNATNTSFNFDMFFPLAAKTITAEQKKDLLYWGNYNFLTFIKLVPSAKPLEVEKKLSVLLNKEREREKNDLKAGLVSLPEMHFEKSIQNPALLRGDKKTVAVFSILGILLLSIACINYVNLTTARATLRIKEVSIRKIVGADRLQLFTQFITESFLVSFIALVIAVIGIYISLPYFNNFTEKHFSFTFHSANIWLILIATMLSTVTLSSVYPAILLSSFKPISFFRGSNIFNINSGSLRKGLVVTQFVLSIALIVASIVVYRQMHFINSQTSTIQKSQLFSFSLPFKIFRTYKSNEQRMQFMKRIKDELKAESSITEVTRINGGSIINVQSWSSSSSTDWDGRDKNFEPKISYFDTDSSFKNILNLQLAEGRWFNNDAADKHNSILNETAIKEFNIRKPVIGQRFVASGDSGIIIGVVKDFYYKSLHEKIGPIVIRNTPEMSSTYIVQTAAGRTLEAKNAAEKIWKASFPNEPFPYSFLSDEYEQLYRGEKKAFKLIGTFSLLAIFISCLGLFGLAAFTAERRKKEIGIRKVVGASVADIVTTISKEFILLILIAFVVASPLAWWAMNLWLNDFAYRIDISWWIFIIAGIMAVIIAFSTMSYHAFKAALNNPVKSLRTE